MTVPTLLLRAIGITRIPILLGLRPRVVRLDATGGAVLVPLGYFSRNHLGSMYLAALAAGADCAAGMVTLRPILGLEGLDEGLRGLVALASGKARGRRRVSLVFRSLRADFTKRADGDVLFSCDEGAVVAAAVAQADETGERVTLPVAVTATVPARYGDEAVARFELELSLKRR